LGTAAAGAVPYPEGVRRCAGVLVAVLVFLLFGGTASAALRLVGIAAGFVDPVHLASTPSQPGRLYVVEQRGVIKVIDSGRVRSTPFLDIRDLVSCCGEQGLLSLAFHPGYATNRRLYVNYTNRAGDTRVVEYRANSTRTRVVESTRRILFGVDQPYTNHNGGQLTFGRDGFLYIGMGDGGSGGDPQNRAQNMGTRLGKLLRLNVDVSGASPVIVALGLRNPWRFTTDRTTGVFYIGDVGQSTREEVSIFRPTDAGLENYGWRRWEGTYLQSPGTTLYQPSRYVPPVYEYATHVNGRCAITGGFVYRNGTVAYARGRYFFGDYCTGEVWSFVLKNGARTDLRAHSRLRVPGALSSFGEGPRGGVYLVDYSGGRIYRVGST
jgi:glucose/arabinose dehydrogenase